MQLSIASHGRPRHSAGEKVNLSVYPVMAICERYVELALSRADFSTVRDSAIDETSRARGHD